jgi:type IV secretion system protein VirB1
MIPASLQACAPAIHPVTLEAVIRVESGGNPLALNVNGLRVQPPPARNAREAEATAERFIAAGYSVDLGLMQVNSRNLPALGLTVAEALEPCANVRAGAAILAADYAIATHQLGEGQGALRSALSRYNTGDPVRGFVNGYVARYYGPHAVPALAGGVRFAAGIMPAPARPAAPAPNPYSADTVIFVRETLPHVAIQ